MHSKTKKLFPHLGKFKRLQQFSKQMWKSQQNHALFHSKTEKNINNLEVMRRRGRVVRWSTVSHQAPSWRGHQSAEDYRPTVIKNARMRPATVWKHLGNITVFLVVETTATQTFKRENIRKMLYFRLSS